MPEIEELTSRRIPTRLAGLLMLFFFASPLLADVIICKDGRRLEGKIVNEEEKRVQILAKFGTSEAKLWIARSDIESIEKGELAQDEFQKRLSGLADDDLDGHQALLDWVRKEHLPDCERVVKERMSRVEQAYRKSKFPRTWCRGCNATGKQSCEGCNGTGKKNEVCVRCNGEKTIKCRACGGDSRGGTLQCSKCAGGGEIEHFDPAKGKKSMVKCPQCKGKGTQPCPQCEGKGDQLCPGCNGQGANHVPCPLCSGQPISTCRICGGKGIQANALSDEELALEAAEAKKSKVSKDKPEVPPAAGTPEGAPAKDKPASPQGK